MKPQDKTRNLSLILLLLAMLVLAPVAIAAAASLSTDKQDYEPGDTVTYTGSGFTAGEVVDLSAKGSTNGTQIFIYATADANGCISGSFDLPLIYEETYTLTATGASSGLEVSASFADKVTYLNITSPASPVTLNPGGTQVYTVRATTSDGSAVDKVPIKWNLTTGGTMSPDNNKTDTDGYASSTYTAGSIVGDYVVIAKHGNEENSDSQAVTILVSPSSDTTPPLTTITLNPLIPNGTNNWYKCDVDVTLTATDIGSGVKEIHYILNGVGPTIVLAATTTFTITSEGINTLDYWAVDEANNVEDTNTATIKIDKTSPTVTITAPAPGCYRTATLPDLAYTVTDNLDPDPNRVRDGWSTDEGEHTVTVTATDAAGNVGSDSVTYTVDNTPPVTEIGLNGAVGNNDWFVSDVNVTLTATDDGCSGVKEIRCILDAGTEVVYVDTFKITEGIHTLVYWAVDNVGNKEPNHSQEIKIDKTPPSLTWGAIDPAPNTAGWNNSVPVKIPFTTDDNLSGVATAIPPSPLSFNAEGQNQTQDVTVTDKAGNIATFTSPAVNIDKTPPVVTITAPTEGAEYLLNQNVSANWSAEDALSGIASASGTVPSGSPIPTATVGSKTFTVTAEDNAGNTTSLMRTYYVRYNFIGFLPPVDNPPVINVGKAGRTFPVKWQLKDANGKFISDLGVVLHNPLRYWQTISGSPIWDEPIPGSTSGASGLRYDGTSNQFIFTWQTSSSFAGKSYELLLELNDGSVQNALFKFTK